MNDFKIAVFGCWNRGCVENSGQKSVADLIKSNESKYKFMVILGDNYYAKKRTLIEKKPSKLKINLTDIQELKNGFECLEQIKLEKKLIMGNHDVVNSYDKSCSILKAQLKLPWYDVKFPFGYDLYYLYQEDKKEIYGTVLFIYLDTTLYNEKLTKINSCYKLVLDKDYTELKNEQNAFLIETLKLINVKIHNIKNVVLFGHEPLFTFSNKKQAKKCVVKTELLDILFEEKKKYNNVNFNWICADYHIYQNSIVTNDNDQHITQLIFGTGGGELSEPPTIPIPSEEFKKYKLSILPNIVYNYDQNETNISEEYAGMDGLGMYGYGEISFNLCTMTHRFVIPNFDYIKEEDIYKSKYKKYKNKYIQLKNFNVTNA